MVSQWNSRGIFSRIHHIAALQQSPRVPVKNERNTRKIHKTDHLHVDVQRHLMVRQSKRMRIKRRTRFDLCEKIFTRKMVIPRICIRKEVVFYSWMGQSRRTDDDNIRRKRTSSFRAMSPFSRGTLKSKGGGKLPIHSCADGDTIETVFRTMLISSVFTEESQICVKNVTPAMIEQGDLLWKDNLTRCLCQQVRWWKHLHLRPMILRKKICCESTKNEWKSCHNKIVWLKFVLKQDSWPRLMSDSTSWQKTLQNSHDPQSQWLVVSTLCQEMKSHLTRKDSKEHQNWARIGSHNQIPTRLKWSGNWNSHSWVRISHGLNELVTDLSNNKENDKNEQETSEMQFENFALKNECTCFCEPIKV